MVEGFFSEKNSGHGPSAAPAMAIPGKSKKGRQSPVIRQEEYLIKGRQHGIGRGTPSGTWQR